MYADDVILFIHPDAAEGAAVKEVLRIFGEASGLRTNLSKCSITPIFGADQALPDLQTILGCQISEFPIRYLGLPLSTRRIPKSCHRRASGLRTIQLTVDAIAKKLPPCHGPLMAY